MLVSLCDVIRCDVINVRNFCDILSYLFWILASPLSEIVEYCRLHCVKNVSIRGFSGPYYPTFELNTEISPYSVWLWEIRTTKNLEYGHLLLNVRHLNCSGKEVLKILNYLKQLDTFDTSQIYLRFFFFFQNQNHGDLYQEGSLSSQTIVSRRIKLQKTFLIHFWVYSCMSKLPFPRKTFDCSLYMISIRFFVMPNFAFLWRRVMKFYIKFYKRSLMIQFWYREEWRPDSTARLDYDVNIIPMHEEWSPLK